MDFKTSRQIAVVMFAKTVEELDAAQVHELITALSALTPAFFRRVTHDVCALYLRIPVFGEKIGFPCSSDSGGYPDFDQPQE